MWRKCGVCWWGRDVCVHGRVERGNQPGWGSLNCHSGWARPPERQTGPTVRRRSALRRAATPHASGGASGDCLCLLPHPLPHRRTCRRPHLPPRPPPSRVSGSPASPGGRAPGRPGPPSPCTCRWGCCAAAGTAAGLWPAAAWGAAAGRPCRAAGGRSCSSAGFPAALSKGHRNSSYSHSRCAAGRHEKDAHQISYSLYCARSSVFTNKTICFIQVWQTNGAAELFALMWADALTNKTWAQVFIHLEPFHFITSKQHNYWMERKWFMVSRFYWKKCSILSPWVNNLLNHLWLNVF